MELAAVLTRFQLDQQRHLIMQQVAVQRPSAVIRTGICPLFVKWDLIQMVLVVALAHKTLLVSCLTY